MASPIQIVLNPKNYEEARDAGGGYAKSVVPNTANSALRMRRHGH